MADNVLLPATGTGTASVTQATDDVSGIHYPKVKLAVGVADGTAAIGHAEDSGHTDGDGGIMALAVRRDNPVGPGTDADYTAIQTDANGRLWVRSAPKVVRVTTTPTGSTSAYATGDCYGGLQEITNAVREAGGSGTLLSVLVLDNDNDRTAMDLAFFDRSITVAGDNAAWAPSDGDMANCLGVIPIGPYNTAWPGTPLNAISTLLNIGLPIVCNGTSLYCQAIVRGTPTKTGTTDIKFIYTILVD
jgi:hypothetical protein